MAKFVCNCGQLMRISGDIPNPIESLVTTDAALMNFADTLTGGNDKLYGDMLDAGTPMLRCPNCDRLWMFWNGWDSPPSVYVFESTKPPGW